MPYDTPEPVVEVFAESASIHAEGQGFMKVVSDEGHVMDWPVVYVPRSMGTVLSPDSFPKTPQGCRRNDEIQMGCYNLQG